MAPEIGELVIETSRSLAALILQASVRLSADPPKREQSLARRQCGRDRSNEPRGSPYPVRWQQRNGTHSALSLPSRLPARSLGLRPEQAESVRSSQLGLKMPIAAELQPPRRRSRQAGRRDRSPPRRGLPQGCPSEQVGAERQYV